MDTKDLPCLNCRLIEMGEMACYQERCPQCGNVPPSRKPLYDSQAIDGQTAAVAQAIAHAQQNAQHQQRMMAAARQQQNAHAHQLMRAAAAGQLTPAQQQQLYAMQRGHHHDSNV